MTQPSRDSYLYTPFYCEENIWHLAKQIVADKSWVIFISNPDRRFPLWMQRASKEEALPILWDYHVVLLTQDKDRFQIWDLDSRLELPVVAAKYMAQTILPNRLLKGRWRVYFRMVTASEFLSSFASDRSHMKSKEDGRWLEKPPHWKPIRTQDTIMNLESFINMEREFKGEILDEENFLRRFCQN
jgi:protein N-terminal glutamine amidohydrolase